jgi:hypothetical protein
MKKLSEEEKAHRKRISGKEYRKKNREKIRKKAKERYHEDVEKMRARQNSYRLKNLERYREREQKYREQNRERITEIREKYLERHGREKVSAYFSNRYQEKREEILSKQKEYGKDPKVKKRKKAYLSNYYKENRHVYMAHSKKGKIIKKNALLPSTDLEAVKEIYYQREKISEETGVLHHVDHIIPLCIGGAHHQDNLRIIPASENLSKHSKYDPSLGGVWANNALAKRNKENKNESTNKQEQDKEIYKGSSQEDERRQVYESGRELH